VPTGDCTAGPLAAGPLLAYYVVCCCCLLESSAFSDGKFLMQQQHKGEKREKVSEIDSTYCEFD
jgi:hypothetical protein